jgi:hypothetical protein
MDLTQQEKRILDYIQANPGTSKQGVVDGLKDVYSRGPIFRTIRDLVNFGMLRQQKDKTNRQTYNLFINSDNLVVALVNDLEKYKISFSRLSSNVTDIPDSLPLDVRNSLRIAFEVMLLKIHTCFVVSYFLTALFKWPILARSDKETLSKLYAIFFTNVQDLQFEYVKSVPRWSRTDFKSMGKITALGLKIQKLVGEMAQAALSLSHNARVDPEYASILEEVGFGKEFESMMDIIWKNSKEFIPFVEVQGKKIREKIEDWREIKKFIKPETDKKKDAREPWIRRRLRELEKEVP